MLLSISLLVLGARTYLPLGVSFNVCSVPPSTPVHSSGVVPTRCLKAALPTSSSMQHNPYKGCSLLTDSSSWVLCRSNWIFLMRGRQKPIAISSFSSLLIPYSCRNKTIDTPEPWFFATSSHERRLDFNRSVRKHHYRTRNKDRKGNVTLLFFPHIADGDRGQRLLQESQSV